MKRRWLQLLWISVSGTLVTLGEAAGRFGWMGLQSGLLFPPEILSQWFFSILPMRLFSLGITLFGEAAKWYAFAGITVLWSIAVGSVLLLTHRLTRRIAHRGPSDKQHTRVPGVASLAPAFLAAFFIEGIWVGVAFWNPSTVGLVGKLGPGVLPLIFTYLVAAWIHAWTLDVSRVHTDRFTSPRDPRRSKRHAASRK